MKIRLHRDDGPVSSGKREMKKRGPHVEAMKTYCWNPPIAASDSIHYPSHGSVGLAHDGQDGEEIEKE